MRFKLAAVILAAGAAHRYRDGNKLLATIRNTSLIRTVAEHVVQSEVGDIVVVTGNEQKSIETVLEGLPLRFAHNEGWRNGIGSSISLGISSVASTVHGAFVILGDMPFVGGELLNTLGNVFSQTDGERIVFPALPNGAQRNPVLWPRKFFPELVRLCGDEGGKLLLAHHASHCKRVDGNLETTFTDIDTLDDLRAVHEASR